MIPTLAIVYKYLVKTYQDGQKVPKLTTNKHSKFGNYQQNMKYEWSTLNKILKITISHLNVWFKTQNVSVTFLNIFYVY